VVLDLLYVYIYPLSDKITRVTSAIIGAQLLKIQN